jgi:hypothetical protein
MAMDEKTKGAWVVHHTGKLGEVSAPLEFENITVAGKAGMLLSAIAQSDQASISKAVVDAYAKAAGIQKLELPALISHLAQRRLISIGESGIEVLGVTTAAVLQNTGKSFDSLNPTPAEQAVLELSELVSVQPIAKKAALERVGDQFKIATKDLAELATQAEEIGFVDSEELDGDRLYFNGNLFRREDARKIKAVLGSIKAEEMRKVQQVEAQLTQHACLLVDDVKKALGDPLFSKLHAIGMYDVNGVSNDTEAVMYVTRPSAFGKFGDPFADDALDLAKAFVTCLTYGMTRSAAARGRIQYLKTLLKKLIAGSWVGPATAIGEDYKVLEYKGVIRTQYAVGGMYNMKLLKRDVGELALHVLTEGDAADATVLHGASITHYSAPEAQRVVTRKKLNTMSPKASRELLLAIRSSGG